MKKKLRQENLDIHEFQIKSILNKNKENKLNEKEYFINHRIKSSNHNKSKQNMKHYYFTQSKNIKRNDLINTKNAISKIKCISYKKLFNFNEEKKTEFNNNKNIYPKLFTLINFKENFSNNNNNLFNSIEQSSRKYNKNDFIIKGRNHSESLIKNKAKKSLFDVFKKNIKNIQISSNKKLNQNYSQYNFFKNNNIIIKSFDKPKIIKLNKNIKYSKSMDKMRTISNLCDASTNTLEIFKNNNNDNFKIFKRPLMIDYSYSEHKKFCYGFDKLKGKNKYKRPYFIVYKY